MRVVDAGSVLVVFGAMVCISISCGAGSKDADEGDTEDVSCTDDSDCQLGEACDVALGECVVDEDPEEEEEEEEEEPQECESDADCADSEICHPTLNECVAPLGGGQLVCDPECGQPQACTPWGECVQTCSSQDPCLETNEDCAPMGWCLSVCTPEGNECSDPTPMCHSELGLCLDGPGGGGGVLTCDPECEQGQACTPWNQCVQACSSQDPCLETDQDCGPMGWCLPVCTPEGNECSDPTPMCHPELGLCLDDLHEGGGPDDPGQVTSCTTSDDCLVDQVCDAIAALCRPDCRVTNHCPEFAPTCTEAGLCEP
ncbi:hypothetical protein ACFL6C_03655 [Myxococcota bacterium]